MSTKPIREVPRFKRTPGIYALIDPRTGRTMYIGQSTDIDRRYRQHCDPDYYESNLAKRRWLEDLRAARLKPIIQILVVCDWGHEADEHEKRLVSEYRERGEAELNWCDGGARNRSGKKINRTSQDDWIELGRKVKAIWELMSEVQIDVSNMVGMNAVPQIRSAIHELDQIRSKLDDLVCRRFPQWDQAVGVFYGDTRGSEPQSA